MIMIEGSSPLVHSLLRLKGLKGDSAGNPELENTTVGCDCFEKEPFVFARRER